MARILVVDDRPINRDLVKTILGYQGHHIIEAADGQEALDRIAEAIPELIITDVVMPIIDGCELVRRLRADKRTADVPVVFYTANYLEREIGPIARAYGVARVLIKGHDPRDLLEAVEQILAEPVPVEHLSSDEEIVRDHLRTVTAKLLQKVSEMERSQEELRRSEMRFRQMAECAAIGIALGEADGNAWYVNTRMAEILGYDTPTLLGAGWRSLLEMTDTNTDEPGEDSQFRREYTGPDGSAKWLVVTESVALGDDGVPFGTVSAINDVTQIVDAEARHRELDTRIRVMERLESLGRLAGGVAHDFNNILTAILAYTEFARTNTLKGMAEGKVDDALGQQTAGQLAKVLAAGNRAACLTAQLLTFGRPDLSKSEVLDVNEVVVEVEDLLARTLGEQIEMVTDLNPELWLVRMDAGQLSQVVLNLAVNARDAMQHAGSLTIRTTNLTELPQSLGFGEAPRDVRNLPAERATGRFVHLSVTDTGRGMPPAVLALAFEPFFTTKTAGEGTGLGLATVHSIIRQAGGRIDVRSEPEQGTTVHVYLPASSEVIERVVTVDDPDDSCAGTETVLIVDDEAAVCEIAEEHLRSVGYQTVSANSGAEALELARSMPQPIDLLLTDLVMPLMNGSELAAQFGEDRPETGVLYMSGYAAPLVNDAGVMASDITVLAKPFTGAALRRAVRTALNAERQPA
jgi:two-component system cell cycle sensor histidine kinase/response regulator CckA